MKKLIPMLVLVGAIGCHSATAVIESDLKSPVYLGPAPEGGKEVFLEALYENILASSSSSSRTGNVSVQTSSSMRSDKNTTPEQFTEMAREASDGKPIYISAVEASSKTFVAGGWMLQSFVRLKGRVKE